MFLNPTVQEFKDAYSRDFRFGTDPNTSVLDSDIVKAFNMANCAINQGLFCDQGCYTISYLSLAAHFLTMNLRASSQGINGQYSFLTQSKSVGSVAEAYAIPQRILDNPLFSMYTKTNYGAQFLMSVLPMLSGVAFSIEGVTNP